MMNTKEKIKLFNMERLGILVLKNRNIRISAYSQSKVPNLILKKVTIEKNVSYQINDFIESCTTNSNLKCQLDYQNEQMRNYTEVGTYQITIIAQDASHHKIRKTTSLTIEPVVFPLEKTNKQELSNSQKIEKGIPKNNPLDTKIIPFVKKEIEKRNAVLEYVNQYRKEVGKKPLILSEQLSIAATIRALEMAESKIIDHIRPDGRECFSIFDDMGIRATSMGENVAYGYQKVSSVLEAWKNSPTHYDNIINAKYTYIGIGVIHYNDIYYWVQLFANKE